MKPKKPPARDPEPDQMVFPFLLRVGDIVLDGDAHAEVVSPPKAGPAGKTTRAWVRREGETVQHEVLWDAWRKVKVIRRAAA